MKTQYLLLNQIIKKLALLALLLITTQCSDAQQTPDIRHSVRIHAEVQTEPAQIRLKWVEDEQVAGYELYRRSYPDGEWGTPIESYAVGITEYIDTDVQINELYEYRIIKTNADFDSLGYGYILSGIEMAPEHYSGHLLILTTNNARPEIEEELANYRSVIESEGWHSMELIVSPQLSAIEVKDSIVTRYAQSPFDAILILGNVAIPHSGDISPDGHANNHRGAWSADVYYGDIDGEWTDSLITSTSSANARNHNIPGDGRFDQSFIPSEVEVAVGRVDFSELPVFTESEYELLRAYLDKNIAFRQGDLNIPRRARVFANNPWVGGLAQNGIRFSPLVSPDSIYFNNWLQAFNQSYLWFNGTSSGNYNVGYQMGNSQYYANNDFKAVFTAWFGSYFGDYDYPDAFMRSHLGSGTVLSSVWAGAPHWHFHAMGMGFPLAESTLATQNNDSIYHAGVSSRSIHINLLGDPTLKSYVFKGPADLEIEPGQGAAALTWSLPDELPLGFYIYRRINAGSPFELIDSVSENTNSYTDKCLGASTEYQYLIRSFRLESTPSGSFYNLSTGPTTAIFISDDNQVVSDFTALAQDSNFISLQSTALNADSLLWILPDGSQPSSSQINFTLEEGDNLIRLIAINSCGSDTSSQSFTLSGLNSLEESSFSIYPNPASSQVWVDLPEKAQRLRLYSLEGQLIRDIPVESSLKFKLDISNLTESNYIIEILLSDGRRSSQQLTISN